MTSGVRNFSKVNGILTVQEVRYFSHRSFDTEPEIAPVDELRNFSISTIKERLRISNMTPRVRLAYTIKDHSRFYDTKKAGISAEELKPVKELFRSDIMAIINTLVPKIIKGQTLGTLLNLGIYGNEISDAGKALSPLYRKSLVAQSTTGDVPKAIFEKTNDAFTTFLNLLENYTFEKALNLELLESEISRKDYLEAA